MPSFLDRHNVTGAKPADLAEAHRLDLEAQASHDVSFLAYWFDGGRGLAVCLADAPSAQAVIDVHRDAHGQVPAEIIEVEKVEVLAFLGRITEPSPQEVAASTFIPESAFRAIMMTDIVDSVGLTARIGQDRAVERFSAHDEVVKEAIGGRHGRIVKHTGDGFLAAFDHVDDALWAADDIQAGLAKVDDELRVRIGINPGNPVERSGDLFGLAVQIAARLCDQAGAGQTLMSGVTMELCQDPSLKERCRDAGRVPIKGLPSAIHAYVLE
jgi:class 3 adenylate cyclase